MRLPIRSHRNMADVETYKLGDWSLQSGQSIPDAQIAYKTFGDSKLPAIIYPSWFSGSIADNEWLVGEDKALNPNKYFIVITALCTYFFVTHWKEEILCWML